MNPVHLPTREALLVRTGPEAPAPAGDFAQALEQAGRPSEEPHASQTNPATTAGESGSSVTPAPTRPAGPARPSPSLSKGGARPPGVAHPTVEEPDAGGTEAPVTGVTSMPPMDANALVRALGLERANAASETSSAPALPEGAATSIARPEPTPPAPVPAGVVATAGQATASHSSLDNAALPTVPSAAIPATTLGARPAPPSSDAIERPTASAHSVPEAAPASVDPAVSGSPTAPEVARSAAAVLSPLRPDPAAEPSPLDGPRPAPASPRLAPSAAPTDGPQAVMTRLLRADESSPTTALAGREGTTLFGAAWTTPALQAPPLTQPLAVSLPLPLNQPAFASELGMQVVAWTRQGVQQAELRLNPAELGPVQVSIQVDGVQTQVRFVAEAAATRDALQAALPELAQALAREGLTLGSADVQAQSQHQAPSHRPFNGHESGAEGRAAGSHEGGTEDLDAPSAGAMQRPVRRGLVDLYA